MTKPTRSQPLDDLTLDGVSGGAFHSSRWGDQTPAPPFPPTDPKPIPTGPRPPQSPWPPAPEPR
jgi:hypothetical protein